jgi:phosphoglycerol geranylgeranyltransferase
LKPGKIEKYINDKIETEGALLLTLIDPANQKPEEGARKAKEAYEAGTDIILVGGSVGAQGEVLDDTVRLIKDNVRIPVVLFPGNIGTLTPYADALYFMSMFNSRDPYYVSVAQMAAAPVVKKMGIEPIPVCYLVIEPGQAVGWVGDAKLLPRDKPYIAAACALAGEYLGARLVLTDSGSGAPSPAPAELIKAVANAITVPYIYGGGVKTPEQADEIIKAGADGIQIGAAFEGASGLKERISEFVKVIKKAGKSKI